MNYGSAMRAKMLLKLESGKLSIQQIVRIALLFSMLFFVGNLAYQESLAVTEVALVNIFSSTSAIFTLLLSSLFPSHPNDRLSASKLFAVVLSLTGLVLVSLGSGDRTAGYYFQSVGLVTGIMWSLLGAFCYSVYLVMFKRAVGSDDNVDIPMFFGFVGLFTMSLLWPGMLLLHYTGLEKFELPDHTQIVFLLTNGLIGTVLSELLWLWGCMLTSSLYGTMSLSLTIPLSVLMDIVIRKVEYNWMLYAGIAPTVASLVAVGYLAHAPDRDPVRRLLRYVFCRACRNTKPASDEDAASQEIPLMRVRPSSST